MKPQTVVDIESRSLAPLSSKGKVKGVGAHRYAHDASTDILCVGFYDIDSGQGDCWSPFLNSEANRLAFEGLVNRFREAAEGARDLISHNGLEFDRVVLNTIAERYGLTVTPIPAWLMDTICRARYSNRPLALNDLAEDLGL